MGIIFRIEFYVVSSRKIIIFKVNLLFNPFENLRFNKKKKDLSTIITVSEFQWLHTAFTEVIHTVFNGFWNGKKSKDLDRGLEFCLWQLYDLGQVFHS